MIKIYLNAFIIMILFFLMTISVFAQTQTNKEAQESKDTQKESTTTLDFKAQELWEKLTKKELTLEFDTPLTVSGIVADTGMSIYATPNVTLSNTKDGQPYVKCVLPRLDFPKLSSYKEGDLVEMKGHYYATKDSIIIKKCERN